MEVNFDTLFSEAEKKQQQDKRFEKRFVEVDVSQIRPHELKRKALANMTNTRLCVPESSKVRKVNSRSFVSTSRCRILKDESEKTPF